MMSLVHNWSSLHFKRPLSVDFIITCISQFSEIVFLFAKNMLTLLSMFPNRFHLVSQINHWVAAATRLESPWYTEFRQEHDPQTVVDV